jgi:DNA replication and repair protein RecF
VKLTQLELVDFRSFAEASFLPDPVGTTVIVGPNGSGKTTILEAIAYLGTQRSFRGASREAIVRQGCDRAVVRATLFDEDRPVLVEADVALAGRSRAQVNRQVARSRRDLTAAVPVTVFSPEDLALVQGGPAHRRDLLDHALRLLDPEGSALLDQLERILRQRAALLRQIAGRLTPETEPTLDVWDTRLADAGTAVAWRRTELVSSLAPHVADAYDALSASRGAARIAYRPSWDGDLAVALAATRTDDVRRGATGSGPHRDDLVIELSGRDARNQASQGEQRCLALALRLGVHRLVGERSGAPPILLLDDVFSELDPIRSRALVEELPTGQTLVTTAVPLPEGVVVASLLDVRTLGDRPGASVHGPTEPVA